MKRIGMFLLALMAVAGLLFGLGSTAQASTQAGPGARTRASAQVASPAVPASIRTNRFHNSITVSGVTWDIICDARWDYGGPGGTTFIMKSTVCKTTRNGVDSTVKFDAIRFYVDNGTSGSQTAISNYQFCGAITTTNDCQANTDATHTQDQNMGNWSGNVTMKTWGLPDPGDPMLQDQSAMAI